VEDFKKWDPQALKGKIAEIRFTIKAIELECGEASRMIHSTAITIERYSRMVDSATQKQEGFKETLKSHRCRIARLNEILEAAEEAKELGETGN